MLKEFGFAYIGPCVFRNTQRRFDTQFHRCQQFLSLINNASKLDFTTFGEFRVYPKQTNTVELCEGVVMLRTMFTIYDKCNLDIRAIHRAIYDGNRGHKIQPAPIELPNCQYKPAGFAL